MDDLVLLIDFGSTYTKVVAFDLSREEIVGRSQSPTTIEENILTGLENALGKLTINGSPVDGATIKRAKKLASSSAAGGLAIVAVGLVPDLTLEAAKQAALGAGAKVVGSHAYELDENALDEIEHSHCDIVLLVGGIDGGNKDVMLHNAKMLSTLKINVPFVIAGNRSASSQAMEILKSSGKLVEKTENVLPELDRLEVEPARGCIRDIFIKTIVRAKGLEKAQEFIGDILMPTPLATLKAASLLSDGHDGEPGMGELMVVEVGGATTNVHSIASGESVDGNVIMKGFMEPYEKRTVEGDLGIRFNAETIVNVVGLSSVLSNISNVPGLSEVELKREASLRKENVSFVPATERDFAIDIGFARSAVALAVERHVGTIKESWGVNGAIRIQRGKDLTGLSTVIGTGGIFAYNLHPERALQAALMTANTPFSLKPKAADFYIDRNYVLYGIGLLSSFEPAIAVRIGKKYLVKI